jgi:hypothetical protein
MKNISNFGEPCCGNFFCSGTTSPQMPLTWGKKTGEKRRLLRKTVEYSQLVIWKILFALSSAQYWIFRRGAQTGDHFCYRALTIYFMFSDYETVAKVLGGEGERPFIKTFLPFPQETLAGVSNF